MAKQLINRGAAPNDGSGDNLRDGADKLNNNFNEIYSAIGDGSTIDASIKLQDESSTQISIPANGGVLRIAGGIGIDTIISGSNDLTIQVDGTVLSATQVSTLENKSIALGDNTITGTTAEFNTALTDDDFATLTNSVTLENKTIDGTQNTLQNIPNSALDSIANSALTNSTFTLLDDTSTADTIALGETFRFTGGTGITSTIGSNEITFGIDNTVATLSGSQELTNKTINASSNTITNITTTELSASANIANTQLANYQITFGADTLALGDTTSTITDLNLDGTSSLSGTGTVDTTGSANKIRFNHAYANVGALESAIPAATYSGMFAYNTTTSNAYVADPGGWSEIVTENSSIGLLSNVDITSTAPTNGQVLVFNSGTGIFEPGDAGASLTIEDEGSALTTDATTLDFVGTGVTVSGTGSEKTINIPGGAAAIIDVTNNGSVAYLFDSHYSGNNPTLYLRGGSTYVFNLDVTGHPFHLQTVSGAYSAGNPYTTGLTHIATDGTVSTGASALLKESGTLYVEVPSGSSTTIYYACQYHSGMAGSIVLQDDTSVGGIADIVDDTTPQLGGQLDVNGNAIGDGTLELLKFSETASAVNELTITNAATGNGPQLSATGDDTNIDLELASKGTGDVVVTGNIVPGADDTYDLGASGNVWANIYTGDLNLSNEAKEQGNDVDGTKGSWTIQEGDENLFLINNNSGKKYKFKLEEI